MRATNSDPVTMVVSAQPAPGNQKEWEETLTNTIQASLKFPGHMGTTVLKQESIRKPTYQIVLRFDQLENLERWKNSPEREYWISRLHALEHCPPAITHNTGLETWFELTHHEEQQQVDHPPKYKIAIIVWISVYVTVIPIINLIRPYMSELHFLLASAITTSITVPLMTWVMIPLLSWLLKGWLYPGSNQPVAKNN
ncbi:MAG TPA: hypothetical protein DCY03_10205 [Planctomycetaceae bacterium]|uniref:antibiotic biosynthesis monooxygenase n=1 Tax=Gimesia maris TaxID=122 RepID=UPI000E9D56E0|nr:hypothetical protein [Planctomycetaceae bacterium]|tara:strand:+ start:1368 stop:1958 length:591 start_codon:yes stop_codon:yes gene_type:complete